MYYRLKQNFVMRGWEKAAWGLVKRPENETIWLSQAEFQALLLCDGETDLDGAVSDETIRQTVRECEKNGFIENCASPQPLDADQYYQYFDNRYVSSVFWSITGRCNYRCRHCYMDAPDAAMGELSTEEALNLIDQMAECGVMSVDITGGEPFVRKDFWQLVDRILSHGMAIETVYTNGWLLNGAVLDEFEKRGLRPEISISFDGVGWHDWMRGISGAQEAALRAFRLCEERGFPTDAEMCTHRGNKDTLMQTIEALRAVGVYRLRVGNVMLTDLWRRHSEGNEMGTEEYIETMLQYIPQYYANGCPVDLFLGGVIALHRDGSYEVVAERYDGTDKCLDCHLCGSARWSCYITPEGRLLPCMPMTSSPEQNRFPKVQDIGLKQGLSDSFYMQFVDGRVKDLLAVNEECASCDYRYKCGGGCRAGALENGGHDLMGCDRSTCILWKDGYVERVYQIADAAIAKYGVPAKLRV